MTTQGPIQTKIKHRRDTSANWTANNPILSEGEIGVDITNNRMKVGDGQTSWNNLNYMDTLVQIVRW